MNMFNKIILKVFCVLFVCMLFTTFGYGEYYQYTDPSGKICYTDDISKIPESQRGVVKKFKSENSVKKVDSAEKNENKTETALSNDKDGKKLLGNSYNEKMGELKTLQAELNQIYTILEKDRKAIEAQASKKGATDKERKEYSLKVESLNAEITEYEKKLKVFNDQVDALNAAKKITTSEK